MNTDWQKYEANPDPKYGNTADAFKKLNDRLEKEGLLSGEKSLSLDWIPYLRVAAAIILFTGLSSIIAYYLVNNNASFPNQVFAENSVLEFDLPDGSQITLNKGSEIFYNEDFPNQRSLKLIGEAFFKVNPDADHPFIISTDKGEITVLGTSFNVKETKANKLEVYVESGTVSLESGSGKEELILKKGMMGESDGKTARLMDEFNPNYLSWKTLDFKFTDTNLIDIIDKLEEAYHVSIEYDKNDLENLRLTTSYQNQSIDTIIQTISTAFKIEYSKEGEKFYLRK
jgi:transmembrane sensor